MEFQNRVLTSDGRELIAQAISSNQRIIFIRAMSSTTYMDDTALVNLRVEDLTGPLGTIKTTSATGNVARIMTEFTNQPVSAKVMTVAVAARLAAQPDAAAIVMLAQSDPTAGIYIPSTAELSTSVQVAFNVVINATGEVEVTPSANVSLGDHERLLERTVTTHADGDPTVGEVQDIKGDKNFKDNVSIGNALRLYGTDDDEYYADISFSDAEGIEVTKDIVPATADEQMLGTHTRYWGGVYSNYGCFNDISTLPNNTTINLRCSISPSNDNTYSFGASDKRFKELHAIKAVADNVVTDKIIFNIDGDETKENYIEGQSLASEAYLEMRTVHSNHAGTGGSLFNQKVEVFSGGAHQKASTIIGFVGGPGGGVKVEYDTRNYTAQKPYKAVKVSLMCGSKTCQYDGDRFAIGDNVTIEDDGNVSCLGIYASSLHGCIPTPAHGASSEPEVGTIFLAHIQDDSYSATRLRIGDVIKVNGTDSPTISRIGPAEISSSGGITESPDHTINYSSGTYKLLCYASFDRANIQNAYALLMRIA